MSSKNNTMVKLVDVGKRYEIYKKPSDRLKQFVAPLIGSKQRFAREFWALRSLSLEITKGEVLGVVGVNGAGKSTLLQLITGVMAPSLGAIKVNGRVAALLELGAGFNPEFTGRENIFLNASLLGLMKAEIHDRYDEIVSFAGLGTAIDQPVKTYSSGMYVRLGFSIATSVDPDLLIIDEALSVGDGAFARKSFDRILGMKQRGTTVIFCSHSLYQVEAFCTRVLWLHEGRAMMLGEPAQVVCAYQEHLDLVQNGSAAPDLMNLEGLEIHSTDLGKTDQDPQRSGNPRIESVVTWINEEQPKRNLTLLSGVDSLNVRVRIKTPFIGPVPTLAFTLHAQDGRTITSGASWLEGLDLSIDSNRLTEVEFSVPKFPLLKGNYMLSLHLICEKRIHIYETASSVCLLQVKQQSLEQGIVRVYQEWRNLHEFSLDVETVPKTTSTDYGVSIRWADESDAQSIAKLFESRFSQPITLERLHWKYGQTGKWGLVAEDQGNIQGFYGGIPRPIRFFGEKQSAVQICDVMVQQSQAHGLSRQGVFFKLASQFLSEAVGFGKPHLLGFGFPTSRALRLGENLGLYHSVSTMTEFRWYVSPRRRSLKLQGEAIFGNNFIDRREQIDKLWIRMASALQDAIVCERDHRWYQHRFFGFAKDTYFGYLVKTRINRNPIGLVILRDKGTELEILDFLCDPVDLDKLLKWTCRFAGRAGYASVFVWASEFPGNILANLGAIQTRLDLYVPTNVYSLGPNPQSIQGKWWLIGGDSDFR